ncbi:hypothetical protein FNV43_RR00476 [Rhamnella rubrinervis]|uniref:Uncharacterized protein n=1 Tax=Rhamnella rubrinervis TaxID=2594499 RepID=A0A8K0HQQ1_9ROSA|nr:hypothetical protein FNV43_RR00476 [Rhamnella rubrinervis]
MFIVVLDNSFKTSDSINLHSQAVAYEKLAESETLKRSMRKEMLDDEASLFTVLPISAESAKMLPDRRSIALS